jgi:dTDP-4-dehydrorhamnose reductase
MISVGAQYGPSSDRYLILGASGLLGAILYRELKCESETYGTFFKSSKTRDQELIYLDATDFVELESLISRIAPTRVINCVGLASVEDCESRPEASWKVNTEIPLRLAQITRSVGAQFVQISTDHFKSPENTPRLETIEANPVNQYGFTKLEAEVLVKFYNPEALILRTNFFGHSINGGRSLLDFALSAIASENAVTGFSDVFFSPVGAVEIAKFLMDSRSKTIAGILNFASNETITKFDFLTLVAKYKNSSQSSIIRSSISNSGLSVLRPNYLALNPSRLIHEIGYNLPSLESMLQTELRSIN